MTMLVLVALALAVISGFWYSWYQSVRRLRAHDAETVRIMQRDLDALIASGAAAESVAAARQRLDAFRTKHNVRAE